MVAAVNSNLGMVVTFKGAIQGHAICPKGNFIDGYLQLLRQNLVQLN